MLNAVREQTESIGAKAPKILLQPTRKPPADAPDGYAATPVSNAPTQPFQAAPATIHEPPDPVPEELVHAVTDWEEHLQGEIRRAHLWSFFTGASITTEACILGGTILFSLLFSALKVAGLTGRDTAIVGLGLLVLTLGVLVASAARDRVRPAPRPKFPAVSDPAARVRVVAKTKLLERLLSRPIDASSGFEPSIFRITFAVEPRYRSTLKVVTLVGVCMAGIILLEELLAGQGVIAATPAYLGIVIGRFSRAFIWPTYLRVSPGRLDVLQYAFLGIGRPRVRTYDLRTSRVALHVHGHLAVFPRNADTGELFPTASNPLFDAEPMAFERTILRAALTTAPAAPLPDDRLTG